MKHLHHSLAAALLGLCLAQGTAHAQMNMGAASATASAPAAYTDAEVRKVDKANRKITLKHGEIKNLGMPPMTMVFNVKDPKALDRVKSGDKVRFKALNQDGKMTVVEIEPAK
jgi:Cu(I)/Ag(I) efflux system protein CusF